MSEKIKIEKSSGNVFADLDLPKPERLLAKAKFVSQIERVIKSNRMTKTEAAERLKISVDQLDEMFESDFDLFSIDSLLTFLSLLDHDILIEAVPNPPNTDLNSIEVRL